MTLVYEYGCLTYGRRHGVHAQGLDKLYSVLRARNEMWNRLVEIEKRYDRLRLMLRDRYVLLAMSPQLLREYKAVCDAINFYRESIRDERRRARGDVRFPPAMLADLEQLKKRRATLRNRIKQAPQKLPSELQEEYKERKKRLEARFNWHVKKVVDDFKGPDPGGVFKDRLWWPNRDDVLRNEFKNARDSVIRKRKDGMRAALKFHRFDGTGKVTVRLRERGSAGPWDMPVENIFTPNPVCWVEPVSPLAWTHPVRAVRRRAAQTNLHFRVGTDTNGNPVWVIMPMVMHRPLPEGGKITQVSLIVRRVGSRYCYKVAFTVEVPDQHAAHDIRRGGETVAVDLAWRKIGDRIRTASVLYESGRFTELWLPGKVLWELNKVKELQSLRDQHFNEAKKVLAEFLKGNQELPQWLRDGTGGLAQWRSPCYLIALLQRWADNRFSGDERVYGWLSDWLKREQHLYDWQCNLRDQALRHRREVYRVFAKRLAERCVTVVVEDFDLRRVARKPEPERGPAASTEADYQRFVVSPSELRQCLTHACGRLGTEVKPVDPRDTTRRCHRCGHINETNGELEYHCVKCGLKCDRDYNACKNLLQAFERSAA